MVVRDFAPADLPRIKEIHGQTSIDYKFPDLASPLFIITKVVELDGQIVAASGVRIEAELYLFVDHEVGTPEQRWDAVQQMNGVVMEEAWMKGLDNCVCWVPEDIEKSFGKRLIQLGFSRDRDGWHSWSRQTKA
jgi:hypothetical protein